MTASSRQLMVIGAGTMGRGISEVALRHGWRVHLVDPDAAQRQSAQASIEKGLTRAASPEMLDPEWRRRLTVSADWDGIEPSWVIEAVPETMALKGPLFTRLDQEFGPEVWLASNTSSIAVTEIQGVARNFPERIGGLHFFNPVPRMALVEVIAGMATKAPYVAAAVELIREWDKEPVVAPDRPGFLVNRVARPYYLEALRMVDDGIVSLETCDTIFEGVGFPMGPFRLMDLVGIDVNFAVTESVFTQTFYDARYRPHRLQQQKIRLGQLGRKSGRGFYRYD